MIFFFRAVRALTLSLFVLFLSACSSGSSDGTTSGINPGEFTLTSPSETIRPQFDELIYVSVTVNGIPARFILDSGADAFLVSSAFAKKAGLPEIGNMRISTIAGISDAPVRHIDSFTLGNVVGADIDAAEVEINGFDGIVGVPFFRAVVMELDYAGGKIVIHDPADVTLEQLRQEFGGDVVDAPNFVLPEVEVNGMAVGPMRIDTGTGGGLRISPTTAGTLLAGADGTLQVVSTATNGSVPGTAFIADEIMVSGFSLTDQFVVVQERPIDVGLIGSLVLKQFYSVIDMGNDKILFRRDRDLRFGLDPDHLRSASGAAIFQDQGPFS